MVKLEDQVLLRKDQFRYLGSIIETNGEINENVTIKLKHNG